MKGYIGSMVRKNQNNLLTDYNYEKDSLLFTAPFGSMNYSLFIEGSDVDTKSIFVPTLQKAVVNQRWLTKAYELPNGNHAEVKDIREMNRMFLKGSVNFLETLVSEFIIWNDEDYLDIHRAYYDIIDFIAFIEPKRIFSSTVGLAFNEFRRFECSNDIRNQSKIISRLEFLKIYIINYLYAVNYKQCFEYDAMTSYELRELKEKNTEPLDTKMKELKEFFCDVNGFANNPNVLARERKYIDALGGRSLHDVLNDIAFTAIQKRK